jgi:hypothetical protein
LIDSDLTGRWEAVGDAAAPVLWAQVGALTDDAMALALLDAGERAAPPRARVARGGIDLFRAPKSVPLHPRAPTLPFSLE